MSDQVMHAPMVNFINPIGMEFVPILPGEFYMGSVHDEENWYRNERPQHKVVISIPFLLGKYTVTQEQWARIMGVNPSKNVGMDNPVDKVSWYDSQEFIRRLNEAENTDKYRLPTEAEWEYACRANTKTRFSFGDNDAELSAYAWYIVNEGTGAFPSGMKKANPWGLHDMHGNIWEWVQDEYQDNYTGAPIDGSAWKGGSDNTRVFNVLRGGSWMSSAAGCRSSSRYYYPPGGRRSSRIGLRIARDL